MLKFVSGYIALSYLAFTAVGIMGVLQMLAAWQPFVGLALFDYRERSIWRQASGPVLILLAYAWFFGTRREILTPGPAGVELMILFGGGVLLALAVTLAGASILYPYRQASPTAFDDIEARSVELGQGQAGTLYTLAGSPSGPSPGICLIPDPALGQGQLGALAGTLAHNGMVVLVPEWEARLQRYPDAMVLSPLALGFLSRYPLADSSRLAVVGVGLGGDLALRSASADRKLVAAVALSPMLFERNTAPGLGLLREMTYTEALAWRLAGRRRPLVRQIEAAAAVVQGSRTPALVIYGEQDALVSLAHAQAQLAEGSAVVRIVPGEGHLSLISSSRAAEIVSQWLTEKFNGR